MTFNFEKQFLINKKTELFITDNKVYIDGIIYETISNNEINGATGLIIKYDGEIITIPVYVEKNNWNSEINPENIPLDKLNSPIVEVKSLELQDLNMEQE
jgi:hypothetical protein